MPAAYTHYAVANALLQQLPTPIKEKITPFLPIYFFGSQGADFCFFYREFSLKTTNLGSYLHREGGYNAFQALKKFAKHSPCLFAYAIGYITHYAADVTFHPYVYAKTGKSYSKHSRFESALDGYFKPKLYGISQNIFRAPNKEEQLELYILYSAIASKAGFPPLIRSTFSRAISLFNAYPPITYTIFKGEQDAYFRYAINEEKLDWKYPANPDILRQDNADELFEKALSFAYEVSQEFCEKLQFNAILPRSLFGKHYLTGL